MIGFDNFTKNAYEIWEIWANKLLPEALKTCPKSNKSPNLVTLQAYSMLAPFFAYFWVFLKIQKNSHVDVLKQGWGFFSIA